MSSWDFYYFFPSLCTLPKMELRVLTSKYNHRASKQSLLGLMPVNDKCGTHQCGAMVYMYYVCSVCGQFFIFPHAQLSTYPRESTIIQIQSSLSCSLNRGQKLTGLHKGGDFRVQHKDHGSSNSTKSVGTGSLEEGRSSFILHNLGEAVKGSAVDPFGLRLFRLHLKTTTDGIEGVRGISGSNGGRLGAGKLRGCTEQTIFILLVGVESRESIEQTKVNSTVGNDPDNGNSNTVVKTSDTRALNRLGETVDETVELLLSSTDIRGKTGTGVIQGVYDHEGTSTGKTSGSHVDGKERKEILVLVDLGEHGLNGILEGEVEGLGREVTNNIRHVTTPEGSNTLFGSDPGEAVDNTSVSGDFSRDNLGVGILGLDQKLHTLDRGSGGLGNGSGDASSHKVNKEIRHDDGLKLSKE